jgi:hypothetical protein
MLIKLILESDATQNFVFRIQRDILDQHLQKTKSDAWVNDTRHLNSMRGLRKHLC